ncbi:hypothetical protein DFH09DRAFT_1129129 [Mycena vulgaris]|nr:hypothetical protein DFH09DRAFT_1129129 [Mycena vulgaris]
MEEIIKFRIIDEIFGLDPVDWNSRYKAEVEQDQLSLAALTNITLCAPTASSPQCTALLAHLNTTFPAQLTTADLVWEWDRLVASYVGLKHFDGAVLNVSVWIAMPTGNESAPFWAYTSAEGLQGSGSEAGFGARGPRLKNHRAVMLKTGRRCGSRLSELDESDVITNLAEVHNLLFPCRYVTYKSS